MTEEYGGYSYGGAGDMGDTPEPDVGAEFEEYGANEEYDQPEAAESVGDPGDFVDIADPGDIADIGGAPPAVLPETGDPQVDAALAPLAGLPRQPVAEHVVRFEQVHRGLQDALAEVDTDAVDVDTNVANGV